MLKSSSANYRYTKMKLKSINGVKSDGGGITSRLVNNEISGGISALRQKW